MKQHQSILLHFCREDRVVFGIVWQQSGAKTMYGLCGEDGDRVHQVRERVFILLFCLRNVI